MMDKKKPLNKELNVMVALDLTQMDPILIKYIEFLTTIFSIKQLYFVHNIKQSVLYSLYEDFISEDLAIDKIVEEELQRTIALNYKGIVPQQLIVTSDNYTESMLTDLAKENHIDVMVVGNKNALQGTGALCQKLVRMLDSHLLLIPDDTQHVLDKILVPTDFSADSAVSFQAARRIAERSGGEIEALHSYSIPSFFFPYIDTEKAHDETQKHLDNRFMQFQKKYFLPEDISFKYVDKQDFSVAETIEQTAEKGTFNMIIVSARGANNLTSLFIGSTTNDLLVRNRKMPLLIIKKQ